MRVQTFNAAWVVHPFLESFHRTLDGFFCGGGHCAVDGSYFGGYFAVNGSYFGGYFAVDGGQSLRHTVQLWGGNWAAGHTLRHNCACVYVCVFCKQVGL